MYILSHYISVYTIIFLLFALVGIFLIKEFKFEGKFKLMSGSSNDARNERIIILIGLCIFLIFAYLTIQSIPKSPINLKSKHWDGEWKVRWEKDKGDFKLMTLDIDVSGGKIEGVLKNKKDVEVLEILDSNIEINNLGYLKGVFELKIREKIPINFEFQLLPDKESFIGISENGSIWHGIRK